MRFDEAYSGQVFIASCPRYEESQAVIYGMPMDFTVSFRPGARFGPARIREVSVGLEEYSPYLDRELGDIRYFDAGDIPLPFGNPEKSLRMIADFVGQVLDDNKFPLGLGGEHLVTWPILQEVAKRYQDVCLVHIDAHADLREEYEGEWLSHATPVRKACQLLGPERVYSFGIRSGTREEFQYGRTSGMHFFPFEVITPLKRVLPELAGKPVYVTIDIDVLDPAFAPGTGTAEAGGISSSELIEAIVQLAKADVEIVGADLVEVAPVYDPTEKTQIVAAKLVREMLLGWVK
jgi:agmatinase